MQQVKYALQNRHSTALKNNENIYINKYLIGQNLVGQNFRHFAKFSSILSENNLISIVLKELVGQNFRHFPKFSSIMSDKVII